MYTSISSRFSSAIVKRTAWTNIENVSIFSLVIIGMKKSVMSVINLKINHSGASMISDYSPDFSIILPHYFFVSKI